MTCGWAIACGCSIWPRGRRSRTRVGRSACTARLISAWKAQVDRQGLEMLRPRERRRPVMPNQVSPVIEQRIVAFALGHPGLGPKRIAAQLARTQWGGAGDQSQLRL